MEFGKETLTTIKHFKTVTNLHLFY